MTEVRKQLNTASDTVKQFQREAGLSLFVTNKKKQIKLAINADLLWSAFKPNKNWHASDMKLIE